MLVFAYAEGLLAPSSTGEAEGRFPAQWPTPLPLPDGGRVFGESRDTWVELDRALDRPGFRRMLRASAEFEVRKVLVVDRLAALGSTLRAVVATLDALRDVFALVVVAEMNGVTGPVRIDGETGRVLQACVNLDQTTRGGRTRRGQERARREGRTPGRPFKLDPTLWPAVHARLARGSSVRATARHFGVAEATIRGIRDRDEMAAPLRDDRRQEPERLPSA
ncbi:MAG: recombinase family protein [Pseudomonadota bacterium]